MTTVADSNTWERIEQALRNGSFSLAHDLLKENGADLVGTLEAYEASPDLLEEAFACACLNGDISAAERLLDLGTDPTSVRSGQSGFHYAAMRGDPVLVEMLILRGVPLETRNQFDGTVLGQALWSAINETMPEHPRVIEQLIRAGAHVWPGTFDWWKEQDLPDADTKTRIGEVLRQHDEFHVRMDAAKRQVLEAESGGDKRVIADSLKSLGNILRRPPFLRNAANEVYERAASMYRELGEPLEEAWVKRHIGINHEYAGRLADAERYYDEALALYRKHSTEDDLDYANAVRYPAVIKERLGKKAEAALLWAEAYDRYVQVRPDGLGEGVAEAAARLTILAIERGDLENASIWFARASEASSRSADPDTHKFIGEVGERLEKAGIS